MTKLITTIIALLLVLDTMYMKLQPLFKERHSEQGEKFLISILAKPVAIPIEEAYYR